MKIEILRKPYVNNSRSSTLCSLFAAMAPSLETSWLSIIPNAFKLSRSLNKQSTSRFLVLQRGAGYLLLVRGFDVLPISCQEGIPAW